jgi:hypothetical protein
MSALKLGLKCSNNQSELLVCEVDAQAWACDTLPRRMRSWLKPGSFITFEIFVRIAKK